MSSLEQRSSAVVAIDDPHFESLALRLHATVEVRSFCEAVQSILQARVPHDACMLYLDYGDFPKTCCASRMLTTTRADRPSEWLQRRWQGNIMSRFILDNPGLKLLRLSDVVPDARRLRASEFFRGHMAPDGWHYAASSLFWRNERLAFEIAMHRTAAQGDFTCDEMAFLGRLHAHIETTLQRLSAIERLACRSGRHEYASFRQQLELLTPAERQLVELIREGCSNKEIAHRLEKSVRTVKTQCTAVYRKFGVSSRSKLLATLI
jgi:DNA-binding CsgD family transcriptional regulator